MSTTPALRSVKWLQECLQRALPHETLLYFSNETKLFESNIDRLTVSESNGRDRTLASIDRAGARVPYRCELYPSASSQLSDKQKELGVMYSNLDRSYSGVPSFPDWFDEWVDGRMVAPDTGIIILHYFTEVLLPRILPRKISIRIPRLVILELEARAQRAKRSNEAKRSEAKRLSLSAFNEVRELRLKANALPFSQPLDIPLLASFSQISGSGIMDAFIRREIRDEMGITLGMPKWQDQIVLLTRDIMMASSASAEDIDAFYFCPARPEKTEFPANVVYLYPAKREKTEFSAILAKVILETAVTFGEIRIEGLFKDHSLICEGMWSGKTVMDWYKKKLRVRLRKRQAKEKKSHPT